MYPTWTYSGLCVCQLIYCSFPKKWRERLPTNPMWHRLGFQEAVYVLTYVLFLYPLSDLRLSVPCRPLAMGIGRIHVNLTTVSNLSSNAVSFFIDKSCYGELNTIHKSLFTPSKSQILSLQTVKVHLFPPCFWKDQSHRKTPFLVIF